MKAAAILTACLLCACGGGARWSERAAHDRIMLVRESPETLGHRRLVYQSAAHPDLKKFLINSGDPDFIAETSSDDRQYLILYYLRSREAFACRTWRDRPDGIEFAGPYPMTDKETDLLKELRDRSEEGENPGIGSGRMIVP